MTSKLEDLIAELCPNGVEYKALSEVSDMKRGTTVTKKSVNPGDIPVISGGREPAYYCDTSNRNGETITVAGSGAGAGFVQYWDKPIFVCDAFSVKGIDDLTLTKFLYYVLLSKQETIYATKKGGGVPHVHISSIENFEIPVPPIEVQSEIVRILDTFTELTENLTAELTDRKKQYEYYRDTLLTFNDNNPLHSLIQRYCPNGVEYKKIGDIGKVSMCKRILKNQTNPVGDIPFYKIGTFGKKADSFISNKLFQEYKQKYSFPNKGDILISAAGTIGREVVYDGEPAYFQDSNIVWVANDEKKILNSFLYYIYQLEPWKVSSGGTISRLYNENIAGATIPVPPLEVQRQIVQILDRFDALCNDLTQGLPAEIEARRKQYEYYRNQLLTFKRA